MSKSPASKEAELDAMIANEAIQEAEAQLQILKVVRSLSRERRERVLRAVAHLLEAEALVPGVFEQFLRGVKP